MSPNQNAYVKNRCISEGGRLIWLVTIDIEKSFDSVNHHFLIAILYILGLSLLNG